MKYGEKVCLLLHDGDGHFVCFVLHDLFLLLSMILRKTDTSFLWLFVSKLLQEQKLGIMKEQ